MAVRTETQQAEDGRLTREQLLEMFDKMRDVQSVELKMSVPGRQRTALLNFDLDYLKARIREVYFFDTPDLALFSAGVVARARRTQGDTDDTVVKLRPSALPDLEAGVRNSPNLKVEMDITRGSY